MSPACPIAGQWSAPGGPVAVDCDPVPPFGLLVALLAALALALTVLAEARRRRRGGGPAWPCAAVIAAGALTAAFLALAALNPHAERVPEPAGRHLVVAVDVSASARRPAGSLDAALDRAAALVAAVPGQAADWTGGVVAFGAGALPVASSVAYADLPGALSAAAGPDGPPPDGTDIAAGLAAAGDLVAAGGRAGAVLLVGDGLATAGDARAAAAALGRQGIPVHVVPTAGAAPGIGVLLVALMTPTSRAGTVRVGPDGRPLVDFALLDDTADLDALAIGVEHAIELLRSPPFSEIVEAVHVDALGTGLAALDSRRSIRDWLVGIVGDYVHASSSCAMGTVVDADGAVHGYDNVHVCDASVFPTIPDVNTHLPTTMLAERLCARWRASRP